MVSRLCRSQRFVFFMEADSFPLICIRFQSVILFLCLDFQFMRIVFLAMVRAMESILLDVLLRLMLDTSPSKQSEGESGMWQPRRRERLSVMSRQNCLIGVQSHVACI